MARYLYLPLPDVDLQSWADQLTIRSGKSSTIVSGANCLQRVHHGDTLYILAHGRDSTPYEVGGRDATKQIYRLTATQLAADLAKKGLRTTEHVTLKLYVCWSGKSRKAKGVSGLFAKSTSFAAELYKALVNLGYGRVTLHGYTEMVVMVTAFARHMLAAQTNRKLKGGQDSNIYNWDDNEQFTLPGFTRLSNTRVQFGPEIIRIS